MRICALVACGLMFIATLATGSFAAETQRKLTVTSDRQSIDYANRTLLYQGNVKITWENYIIEADEVQVYITPEETLEKIIAIGDVKINQDTGMQGFCQKATYLNQEEILILEEEVEYRDEMGNTLQAQKATIWTREERLQAEGNPVKATYILKEEESGTTGGESQ